jgi:hypothetical protein
MKVDIIEFSVGYIENRIIALEIGNQMLGTSSINMWDCEYLK